MKIADYKLTVVDDDGVAHEIASDTVEPVDPPVVDDIWAEDGFSKEVRYGVCFMNKAYNDHLDAMMLGDEYDQRAASEAKRWLCMYVPGRELSEDQLNLIRQNFNRSVATQGGAFIGRMMHYYGFYLTPDNKVDEATTPCIGFNFRDVYNHMDLLIHNIDNKAAYYRSRREGMPQPISSGDDE